MGSALAGLEFAGRRSTEFRNATIPRATAEQRCSPSICTEDMSGNEAVQKEK